MVKKTTIKYYEAIGRRKSSIARVRLYIMISHKEIMLKSVKIKRGELYVNGKYIHEYFQNTVFKNKYTKLLQLVDSTDRFAVSIHVSGGGLTGQLDAILLGIARALEKVDKEYRPLLKKEGFLTRDARIRERRKVGTGGKARRKKQSPKR